MTRIVVRNEESIGHIYPEQPHLFWPMASKIGGPHPHHGCTYVGDSVIRDATEEDFTVYRVHVLSVLPYKPRGETP